MTDDLDQRVEELFDAVFDLPPEERERILEKRGREDQELRRHVEALLVSDGMSTHLTKGVAIRPSAQLNEAGTRIGPYQILEVLGEGGMGVVYLAEQEHPLQRRVALKLLKIGMDTDEVLARFEVERQALALMNHPYIARVHDAGATDDGRPFFVMEQVRGVSLTDFAAHIGLPERLELFISVCEAVQYAHQKGVIHRDLKPSNILVKVQDDRPVPKIIDFGVAKATSLPLSATRVGQLIGTPEYMSPEQVAAGNQGVDTRTDVYSLGVILYQLLAGRLPYELRRKTPHGALRTICEEEPARVDRRFRGDLETIVTKALEKDRSRRYQAASDLAADVRRYLRSEPLEAKRDSVLYVLNRFVARHRASVASGILGVVLLVAFTVVSLWQGERNRRLAIRLDAELTATNIERGRLLGMTGNVPLGERLLWREFLRDPESLTTRWALWELYSHQPCLNSVWGNDVVTFAVVISPDQTRLASASDDHAIRLWHFPTLRLTATLRGHTDRVSSVAFDPDGRTIASGSFDGTIRIWDVRSGNCVAVLPGDPGEANRIAFSPVRGLLGSAGTDSKVRIWEASTESCVLELPLKIGTVGDLTFSADGQKLAVAGLDGNIKLWKLDLERAAPAARECLELRHEGGSQAVAFSPDDRVLATGGRWTHQTIRLWDVATGEPLKVMNHVNSRITRLVFSPDGRTLRAGGGWAVEERDVASGDLVSSLGYGVNHFSLSEDGEWLAMAVTDSRLQAWETARNRCLTRRPAHDGAAYTLAVAPDSRIAATGGQDGVVRVWHVTQRREIAFMEHGAAINAVRFSPDQTCLASVSVDGSINIWDVGTWRLRCRTTGVSPSGAPIAFHSNSRRVLFGRDDGRFTVWDIGSGRELHHFAESHQALWATFSPDGARLATTSRDTRICLRNGRTLELLEELNSPRVPVGAVWSLAFSPDGRTLASGTWQSTVELWDVESHRLRVFEGHDALVRCVAFDSNGDGRLLASASNDGTIKLWDTESGSCLVTLNPHSAAVYAVAFVPCKLTGSQLLSVHGDGTLGFWDLGYYNQHIAGNLEDQLMRLLPDLADAVEVEKVRRVVGKLIEPKL